MKMKTLAMVYLTATALLLSACVSQQKYNALDQEYQQLQQSMTAEVGA
jgi:PBP1b-binding outer membrane lipoprotein LpoB